MQRRFAAVLFTDIVGSTTFVSSIEDTAWRDLRDRHDRIGNRVTGASSGRVVKNTGDGVLAVFDAPSNAVSAATKLRSELEDIGLTIRAGLDAGEIEEHSNDVSGLAVNLAGRVEQAAPDGAILVSSTVKDMMLGTDLVFEDRGEHTLKGIDGAWRLYEIA